MVFQELLKSGPGSHMSVRCHYLTHRHDRGQSGQLGQTDSALSMTSALCQAPRSCRQWENVTRSSGRVALSAKARMVAARSNAETPVVTAGV